jgi:hypothetical protein
VALNSSYEVNAGVTPDTLNILAALSSKFQGIAEVFLVLVSVA